LESWKYESKLVAGTIKLINIKRRNTVVKQVQHGDVLLKRIENLPQGTKPVQRLNGSMVIMDGEATGHKHSITENSAQLWELKWELYLEVTDPVTLQHEEHKPLAIPSGIYQIG
jgi:hypothetical protein